MAYNFQSPSFSVNPLSR